MKARYDEIYNEVFSEYFIKQREKQGLTVEDVAQKLDIKYATFYHYEKGLRDCPLSVFKKLCEVYNLDFYATFHFLVETVEMRNEQ